MGARREGGPAPESWDLPPTLHRHSLAHSLGRAGPGRVAQRVRGLGTWRARPGRSRLTSGGQAGSRGGLGWSKAGEDSPGPACLPLPHLLGRLSVTRGGEGGPGRGRTLIGPLVEAGGAGQPRLCWARRAEAGAGRWAPGRTRAQPRLPTPSRRIASRLGQLARPGPGPLPAQAVPCAFLMFSPCVASFWTLWDSSTSTTTSIRNRSTQPGTLEQVPGSAVPSESSLSIEWDPRGGLQAASLCPESGLGRREGLSPGSRCVGKASLPSYKLG